VKPKLRIEVRQTAPHHRSDVTLCAALLATFPDWSRYPSLGVFKMRNKISATFSGLGIMALVLVLAPDPASARGGFGGVRAGSFAGARAMAPVGGIRTAAVGRPGWGAAGAIAGRPGWGRPGWGGGWRGGWGGGWGGRGWGWPVAAGVAAGVAIGTPWAWGGDSSRIGTAGLG